MISAASAMLPVAGAMDTLRGLLAAGTLVDVASGATVTGGQIYDPITGDLLATDDCVTDVPVLGAGSLKGVAAFQEWTELVPPDPGDWTDGGGNDVVTDLGDGVYNVLQEDAAGTYLRHDCTIAAADHTVTFEWRKTPGTSETGTVTVCTVDAGGPVVNGYLTAQTPPENWTRISATVTEDGNQAGVQIFDTGGAEYQIRDLSYRATACALPFTGLSAGTTRAATDATVDPSAFTGDPSTSGGYHFAYIPYGTAPGSTAIRVFFYGMGRPQISITAAGEIEFLMRTTAGVDDGLSSASLSWEVNKMYVISCIYTTDGRYIYRNGELVASDNHVDTWQTPNHGSTIGRHPTTGYHANGALAAMWQQGSPTALEHRAIATCLRAGTYFEPQA